MGIRLIESQQFVCILGLTLLTCSRVRAAFADKPILSDFEFYLEKSWRMRMMGLGCWKKEAASSCKKMVIGIIWPGWYGGDGGNCLVSKQIGQMVEGAVSEC